MKTKNIFRMLLVAAALLLGANNVKADEWSINFVGLVSTDKTPVNISSDVTATINNIDFSRASYGSEVVTPIYGEGTGQFGPTSDKFTNAERGNKIRIYANFSDVSEWQIYAVSGWFETLEFLSWKGESDGRTIKNTSSYDVSAGYLDLELSETSVTKLQEQGFTIQTGLSVSSIALVNGDGSSFGAKLLLRTGSSWILRTGGGGLHMTNTGTRHFAIANCMEAETITINANMELPAFSNVTFLSSENNSYIYKVNEDGNVAFEIPRDGHLYSISIAAAPTKYAIEYYIDNVLDRTDHYFAGAPVTPYVPTRDGYIFSGWDKEIPSVMPEENLSFNGSFTKVYNLNLIYDNTQGQVSAEKTVLKQYEQATITVTPNSGYEVASVTNKDSNGNDIGFYNTNPWTFGMPASDVTFTVTFREASVTTYTITNNGATNGSVSADKSTAAAGETVTLSNTPNTGYELDYYIVTGENNTTITVNGNQFTMPAGNVWISAVFKQIEYAITINASENGTVSANKATGLHYNDNVTLTITPNSGFELDQLFVKDANNNPINVNNYQFQMPASNVTVSATFKSASEQETPTTYSITIHSMQNGSVVASKTSDITAGEEITLTVTPNSGYQLTSLNVKDANDATITVSDNNTFTMPASNVTISAIFSLISVRTEYASIGNWGYATFSSGSALNFANVTGIKAYVATSVDNQQVTLTQVMGTVAEGTGLVIIRDDNNSDLVFEIPVVQSGSEYNNNLLVPGYGNPLTLSNSYTDYVLTVKDGEVKFAEVWSEKHLPTIDVGKAYLHIPATNGAHTRSLSVVIDNGTTGINGVENEQRENVIYNLRGQRVENPTKGLYIINGKKVIIK